MELREVRDSGEALYRSHAQSFGPKKRQDGWRSEWCVSETGRRL